MTRRGIKSRLALVALAPGLALGIAAGRVVVSRLHDRDAAKVRESAIAMGNVQRLRAGLNGGTALTQLVTRLPLLGVPVQRPAPCSATTCSPTCGPSRARSTRPSP